MPTLQENYLKAQKILDNRAKYNACLSANVCPECGNQLRRCNADSHATSSYWLCLSTVIEQIDGGCTTGKHYEWQS